MQNFQIFGELGSQDSVKVSTAASLDRFVCPLYGEKRLLSEKSYFGDVTRGTIRWLNYLYYLPARRAWTGTIRRANYVARIWRQASHPMMNIHDPKCQNVMAGMKIGVLQYWTAPPPPPLKM